MVVIAYLLGTRARADSLAVALGPIDIINTALLNTMLVAFVPLLMTQKPEDRAALFVKAWRVFPMILACVTVTLAFLAPNLVHILGPGLAPAQHREAVSLLRLIAPAIFLGGSSAVFAALLQTERSFLIPALFQACVNGGMILSALILWPFLGIDAFAIGYTFGAAVHLVLTWTASLHLRQGTTESTMPLRVILVKPAMYLVYSALIAGNILATRAFATHAGPGMAAAFDYCLRCISVVVAYLVYPVANSLLPEVALLRTRNESAHAFRLIDRSLTLMAGASVLACAVGLLLRKPVISLLFERGSFNAESTAMVSAVFLGFAPAIIGWTLLDLISRCSFALDRPILPVACGAIPVVVNLLVLSFVHVTPTTLAMGASAGLMAGFLVLFGAAHLWRRDIARSGVHDADVVVRMN